MYSGTEHSCFGQDGNSANTIKFHLDVRITIGVPKIGKVRTPSGVLSVSFHNDSIFVQCVGKSNGSFGFLPGVEIVWLLPTEPVR